MEIMEITEIMTIIAVAIVAVGESRGLPIGDVLILEEIFQNKYVPNW